MYIIRIFLGKEVPRIHRSPRACDPKKVMNHCYNEFMPRFNYY